MRAGRKLFALVAFGVLPLAACGDKEPERAKAFVDLLQTRVLDRPGVHIPILSDEEREKIGHYVEDLAILHGFNDDLNVSLAELAKAVHATPKSGPPLDLPKYKPDFVAARAFFPRAIAAVETALAKAQSQRTQLHQPEAVKAKFDAAYEQIVVQPARASLEVFPLAIPAVDAEIEIADFIDAHKADLKQVGNQLSTSKPALRKEFETLFAAYVAKNAKAQEARRKLEIAVEGH
jgi:hypothetical protein